MTASSIAVNVRGALKTAFSSVAANVYDHVPEAPIVPAIVVVPDAPYLEFELINKSTLKCKVNLTVTCIVAYHSNPAALDNLEQLVISATKAIPSGWEVDSADQPKVTEIGASVALVSDIRISTYYTQTA